MIKRAIAKYIEEKGIKQIYVAQKAGISPQSFSLILRDERGLDIEEYSRICDALDVPYEYFFNDKFNPPSKKDAS